MMYYVYLLKCNDGSTYTGCTEDLRQDGKDMSMATCRQLN